jgi:Ca2+-transporting ATPase
MVGHVALAFVSRSDRGSLLRLGPLSNRVMDAWALAATAFVPLAVYVPALREALRFAAVAPSDLAASAALGILLVAPAELAKG